MGSISNALGSASAGNGIDVRAIVDNILNADRAQERIWQTQQARLNLQTSALQSLNTDLSDVQAKVQALRDLSGAFRSQSASVSDSGILTATAGSGASTSTHTIVVESLATTSSYYTGYQASGSASIAPGAFDLQVGSGSPVTVTINQSNNTLDQLASSINNLGAGVRASVITDANGARLSLVSETSGAAGDLSISNDTTGLGFIKGVSGVNASLTVDGVPVSSASNTVANVIPGVTLNLLSKSASQVTINVQPDTAKAAQAVNSFVSSYNKIIGDINTQFQYDSNTKTAGVLAGDSTLRILQQQLLSDVSAGVSGGNSIQSLGDLGVTLNDDGTMTVDSAKLQDALSANYEDVRNFFQTASTGFAERLGSDLAGFADPSSGAVAVEIHGLTQSSSDITNQMNDFEARLVINQQQLLDQYSKIDATLRQLPLLLSQINNQLLAMGIGTKG